MPSIDELPYFEGLRRERFQDRAAVFGRPPIGEDAPIAGGVYCSPHLEYVITVDTDGHAKAYERHYQRFLKHPLAHGQDGQAGVVRAVFDTVRSMMRFSDDDVARLSRREARAAGYPYSMPPNLAIDLATFFRSGVGDEAVMTLTAALFLQRRQAEGVLSGAVQLGQSSHYNRTTHQFDTKLWVRHTDPDGNVTICHPGMNHCASLVQSYRGPWEYYTADERLVAQQAERRAWSWEASETRTATLIEDELRVNDPNRTQPGMRVFPLTDES